MGGAWSRRLAGASVVLGLVAAPSGAATASAGLPTRACGPRTIERCGWLVVPLDRSGALPGTIRLRVRVRPPLTGKPSETILALAGGPGQAGAELIDDFVSALGPRTLRGRRLVAFDQRGTGRSGRLRCRGLARVTGDTLGAGEAAQRAVADCAGRLGPARSHYATADSVEDIEALRAALGVERLILYGTSYGTKVALDYAAAHPEHVGHLVLDSVVLPGGVDPFLRTTLGSIPRVLRSLCARDACPFAPDPGGELARLARRLGRGPLRGVRVDDHGRRRTATVTAGDLFSLLLSGDLDPVRRALLPAAVHGAVTGDPALLLRLANVSEGSPEDVGVSGALYLATTCADGGVPWAPGTPIADRGAAVGAALAAIPPHQLEPFGAAAVRDFGFADLCRSWPEAPVPQPHGPLPDVPAVILSGDLDLRTPRADALALAARLPRARVVTVPQTGHSTLASSICAEDAVRALLADRPIRRCRVERHRLAAPISPPPRSLGEVRRLPGLAPRIGRTLVVVVETFGMTSTLLLPELSSALASGADVVRIGGLRGGALTITQARIRMRRFSLVPGVALDVRIERPGFSESEATDDAPVMVRVGGRAAARGVLRVGDRWTVGRLDGHRIRLRTRVLGRVAGGAPEVSAARAAGQTRHGDVKLPDLPATLRRLLGWS